MCKDYVKRQFWKKKGVKVRQKEILLCGKRIEREEREKTGLVKDNEWILLIINS